MVRIVSAFILRVVFVSGRKVQKIKLIYWCPINSHEHSIFPCLRIAFVKWFKRRKKGYLWLKKDNY